jgi:hypothetical protein
MKGDELAHELLRTVGEDWGADEGPSAETRSLYDEVARRLRQLDTGELQMSPQRGIVAHFDVLWHPLADVPKDEEMVLVAECGHGEVTLARYMDEGWSFVIKFGRGEAPTDNPLHWRWCQLPWWRIGHVSSK